jgi:hypothetical protein
MVAQPLFSMTDRRFHDETLLNSTNFAGASAWCWNFSTQIGTSAATTAASARWVAIFSAVLPSVHPSDENPTTVNATAPTTAPHIAGFTPGWIFISLALALGEANFSCFNRRVISSGEPANVRLGNYSEWRRRCSIVGYWRRCFLPGGEVRRTLALPVGASRVVTAGPTVLCHVVRRARVPLPCRDFVYLDLG